jgi:hypothetical protein
MTNKVTEKDLKCFMELKAPTKGIGFFSEEYSGDRSSFIEGLEGDMSGNYDGCIVLLPKKDAEKSFKEMTKVINEHCALVEENSIDDVGIEVFLALWEINESFSLIINAEFGGSDEFCENFEDILNTSCFRFNETMLTIEDFENCEIELSDEYKNALTLIKK